MENRRRRTRVDFQTRADVRTAERSLVDLETHDLSLKGVLIRGRQPVSAGEKCQISVRLMGGEPDSPELHMEGRVIRVDDKGTAIDFTSLDPDTYLHLRNLVLLNADDPDEAEQEMANPAFDPAAL